MNPSFAFGSFLLQNPSVQSFFGCLFLRAAGLRWRRYGPGPNTVTQLERRDCLSSNGIDIHHSASSPIIALYQSLLHARTQAYVGDHTVVV